MPILQNEGNSKLKGDDASEIHFLDAVQIEDSNVENGIFGNIVHILHYSSKIVGTIIIILINYSSRNLRGGERCAIRHNQMSTSQKRSGAVRPSPKARRGGGGQHTEFCYNRIDRDFFTKGVIN